MSMGFLPVTTLLNENCESSELFFSPTKKMVKDALGDVQKKMLVYLAPQEASVAVDSILSAASFDPKSFTFDSARLVIGASEFASIMVESEMSVNGIIGGIFHYSSVMKTLLDKNGCGGGLASTQLGGGTFSLNLEDLEVDGLQRLAGMDIEKFGLEAAKVAMSAARYAASREQLGALALTVSCLIFCSNQQRFPLLPAHRLNRIETIADSVFGSSDSGSVTPTSYGSLRSLLLTTTSDWRALAIRAVMCLYKLKLYERLHKSSPSKKRHKEYVVAAREAHYLFAPLAKRLGMHRLKSDLDEHAFHALYPHQSERMVRMLNEGEKAAALSNVLEEVSRKIKQTLQEDDVFMEHIASVAVSSRQKEPFSIWKKIHKMRRNLKRTPTFLDIPDAMAVRVILKARPLDPEEHPDVTRARERALCYYVQDILLKKFPDYDPAKNKDYVATPKQNGYQSLHATSSTRWHGATWPFEIQIRSADMHRVAEYGLAAHWSYKIGDADNSGVSIENASTIGAYLKAVKSYDERRKVVMRERVRKLEREKLEKENLDVKIKFGEVKPVLEKGQREPYLDALDIDKSALVRESVFVFVTDKKSGDLCRLPVGSTVRDAVKAVMVDKKGGARVRATAGMTATAEEPLYCNGSECDVMHRLSNGDVVSF